MRIHVHAPNLNPEERSSGNTAGLKIPCGPTNGTRAVEEESGGENRPRQHVSMDRRLFIQEIERSAADLLIEWVSFRHGLRSDNRSGGEVNTLPAIWRPSTKRWAAEQAVPMEGAGHAIAMATA
jgi:hypothetical protein